MKEKISKKSKKIELLAPAGDMEKFYTCIKFGADAVYLAGKKYGLRAYSGNFSDKQIAECCDYAHKHGVKVYVTVNIFAKEDDFVDLADYLRVLQSAGVDAIIVSDLGILSVARAVTPNLTLHISTQASITNSKAVSFLANAGAKRVVLARECSLEDIKRIVSATGVETETFVHGAMCVSMSGRCLLSNYYTGRKSNNGECVQACRWLYNARPLEISPCDRPDDTLVLTEDERGSYLLNSKDLNMINHLPDLIDAGITSLKIEGRMKSPYYVATVVNAYRRAIDDYYAGKEFSPLLAVDLDKASHREYTTGFYYDEQERQNYASSRAMGTAEFIAVVISSNGSTATVEMRNKFCVGDVLEILSPNENFNKSFTLTSIANENFEQTDTAKIVQHKYTVNCPFTLECGDILRRKN